MLGGVHVWWGWVKTIMVVQWVEKEVLHFHCVFYPPQIKQNLLNFRKHLHSPINWSLPKWDKTCATVFCQQIQDIISPHKIKDGHYFYTPFQIPTGLCPPLETSLGSLIGVFSVRLSVLDCVHPSFNPSVQKHFLCNKTTQTALIDWCFYRGVLHVKLSDECDIDLCVTFLNFDICRKRWEM